MLTSKHLQEGRIYTRENLRELFQIRDATINTGIFQPCDHESIWLFVTEQKTADRTPYRDFLDGDTLNWEGQTSGRKDQLIIEHERRGLEILVFYRKTKLEHAGGGFRYEGCFRYQAHSAGQPTRFVLCRFRP